MLVCKVGRVILKLDSISDFCLVLKKGGNAVDAAIASTLCIGVIDSFATGKIIANHYD